MKGNGYSIAELATITGVSRRLIHAWKEEGLLPRARGRGRYARYHDEHLLRLRIINALRARRMRLRDIRSITNAKTFEQLQALFESLREDAASDTGASNLPSAAPALAGASENAAPSNSASLWQVMNVRRGLVIMVCVEEGAEVHRLARDMFETYRQIAARIQSA